MRIVRVLFAAIVMVVGGLVAATGVAAASGGSCVPADQAEVTATINSSGDAALFTVQNGAVACDAIDIGLGAYVKDAAGFVTPQTLVTSTTGIITSGSMTLSITLPGSGTKPDCFSQVDAFTGAPLPEITSTEQYGSRLLDFAFGTFPNCTEAQTQTTAPTTTAPSGVEGAEVSADTVSPSTGVEAASATSPTAVQNATLARTGPGARIGPLAAIGFVSLMLGGLLVVTSNRRVRRTRI